MTEKSIAISKKNPALLRLISKNLVLIAIVGLVAVTAIVEGRFFTTENLSNILRQFGPLSFVSLGMTFVIIGGFIDLSVAGVMSLSAVVSMSLIDTVGEVPAMLAGLLVGLACGLLTSTLLISSGALTQARALFITFGMSEVYSALALIHTGGVVLNMRDYGSETGTIRAFGQGTVGPVPISFILFFALLVLLNFFHKNTIAGRSISLSGGNREAAHLSGIKTNLSVLTIFCLCGVMSSLGAVNQFARTTTAAPTLGDGFETNAILAVVVGGTTLKGGKGSAIKTILGTLLIVLMSNCLNLLGVSPYLQFILRGAILVIAIWLDNRTSD